MCIRDRFKIFRDSTRIKILYVLLEAEMCVCDIAQLLNMKQSAISHQLRVLKQSQLVKFRREGKTVFYSLAVSYTPLDVYKRQAPAKSRRTAWVRARVIPQPGQGTPVSHRIGHRPMTKV